ncbi:MAG: aminopeptidase [Clostridia bacterium]|nr:aminopeptidase [Clostridia bacterium]
MTLLEMKHKYAYTLARVGLNVQKGQIVVVEAAIEGYEFTPIFAEECYKLGASNVIINYLDNANLKVRAHYTPVEVMEKVDDVEKAYYEYYMDQGAAFCRLEGVNPLQMADMPEAESNAVFKRTDNVRNIMRKYTRNHCQWLIAMIPTQEWADYILPNKEDNLTELWNLLFKLCYIDEENDVVKTWEEKNERKNALGDKMDALQLRKLHYTASNGTDLTVELTPDSFFGFSRFRKMLPANYVKTNCNIPTEEICTSPEKYGTNGVVYASRPLVLGGKAVENFGFRFENGKVVEVIAEEGKEMLESLVATDEGAAYLGEAALVEYHSPISMSGLVYYTTLIDENASCHLALGRALGSGQPSDPNYTFNNSQIHIDFMVGTPDMSIIGTDVNGAEHVIFKDGDFAI